MPVKIRLTRMGKKKQPTYRVVVVDSRKPRDGAHIEQIGRYDPREDPSVVEIDNDRALKWLEDGAQPTERARKLLEISGAWGRFRVARGEIHTIEDTPAPQPSQAEPDDETVVADGDANGAPVMEDAVEPAADDDAAPEADVTADDTDEEAS